jgi:hypothetical protein
MRTVNRSLVPVPAVLSDTNAINEAVEVYRSSGSKGKPNNSIYSHETVLHSLSLIYYNKCFLCESLTSRGGDQVVEHFLPHSPATPERAYDWNNLNTACRRCNDLKRKNEFKETDPDNKIIATLLLDPSRPPQGFSIESIISFDSDGMEAAVTDQFSLNLIANNTKKLLNDPTLRHRRRDRADALRDTIIQRCSIRDIQKLCALDPLNLDQFHNITKDAMLLALEAADRLCLFFLRDSVEHCTSMRRLVETCYSLCYNDLKRLGVYYSQIKGKPCVYA